MSSILLACLPVLQLMIVLLTLNRGQVPSEAEGNFLKKACSLDTYGVDPHPVKVTHIPLFGWCATLYPNLVAPISCSFQCLFLPTLSTLSIAHWTRMEWSGHTPSQETASTIPYCCTYTPSLFCCCVPMPYPLQADPYSYPTHTAHHTQSRYHHPTPFTPTPYPSHTLRDTTRALCDVLFLPCEFTFISLMSYSIQCIFRAKSLVSCTSVQFHSEYPAPPTRGPSVSACGVTSSCTKHDM